MKPLTGKVISTKNIKTVVVSIETRWQHPLYKKTIKRNTKFQAHDELGAKDGDIVSIVSCRPMSKQKRWKTAQIISNVAAPKTKEKSTTTKKTK